MTLENLAPRAASERTMHNERMVHADFNLAPFTIAWEERWKPWSINSRRRENISFRSIPAIYPPASTWSVWKPGT